MSKARNKGKKHCWPTLFWEHKKGLMDTTIGLYLMTLQMPECVAIKIAKAKLELNVKNAMCIYVLLKTITVLKSSTQVCKQKYCDDNFKFI